MEIQVTEIHEYIRWRKVFPTVWCSGCGIGTVMGTIIRAIHALQIPKDKVSLISGIGCSSRMPIYLDFNTLHTTHGRAIPFATGVKLSKPDMTVLVVSGDGDGMAIGGNHFIHACRRNIDLTMILINNGIYGMTGGQVAPTTPLGAKASTTPYGSIDPPFVPVELALGSGATFVARGTSYHVNQTINYVRKAIEHKGFSMVEIMAQCPTLYGRLNNIPDPRDLFKWLRDNAVPLVKAQKMTPEELGDKFAIGIFRDEQKPEYCDEYSKLCERVQKKMEG